MDHRAPRLVDSRYTPDRHHRHRCRRWCECYLSDFLKKRMVDDIGCHRQASRRRRRGRRRPRCTRYWGGQRHLAAEWSLPMYQRPRPRPLRTHVDIYSTLIAFGRRTMKCELEVRAFRSSRRGCLVQFGWRALRFAPTVRVLYPVVPIVHLGLYHGHLKNN